MPLGRGQEEWGRASWEEVCRYRNDYHTRRTNFGEDHPKTKEAKQAWDDIKARHYGSLRPERRAHELSNLIKTKEQRRDAKQNKLGEMQANLGCIEAELASVEARRDEAVQAMQRLQEEIRNLEVDLEKARSDRVEVLQLASHEARTESWRRSQAEPPQGSEAERNMQTQFLQMALLLRGLPGVDHMLRAVEAAGVGLPNTREQSCPRERSDFDQGPSRKRSLDGHRSFGRREEDMQTDGESIRSSDLFDFEPADQEPGARRQHQLTPRSSQQAQEDARRLAEQHLAGGEFRSPNLMGHIAWGGNPPILAPRQPSGAGVAQGAAADAPSAFRRQVHRSGNGPYDSARGVARSREDSGDGQRRGRSRPRAEDRRREREGVQMLVSAEAQRRQTAAVEEFQQHHRAALAHQAAAAALVQGDGEAEQAAPHREQQGRQRYLQVGASTAAGDSGGGADEARPRADARVEEANDLPVLDLQEQSSQLYG